MRLRLDISVIIPTYQEEEYIKETLAHLARAMIIGDSNGISSEICVIDSGCDETAELAQPITDKVYKFNERGVSKARNFGVSKTAGNILVFMDADVIVPANLFDEVNRAFSSKSTVAAISRVKPSKTDLHPLPASKRLFYAMDDVFIINCVKHKLLLRFYNRGDVLAVRRDTFLKIGGFNENLASMEITELIVKLSQLGKVALLKTTVYESVRRLKRWGVMKSYLEWWRYYALYWLFQRRSCNSYETVR